MSPSPETSPGPRNTSFKQDRRTSSSNEASVKMSKAISMMSEFNESKMRPEDRDHIIIEDKNENRTSVMKSHLS